MPESNAIETERLVLRHWTLDDYGPFAQLNADSEVMEFFPNTLDRVESDALAERIRQSFTDRGWGLWAVEEKDGVPFLGFVGQGPISRTARCPREIGFFFGRPFAKS